MEGTDSADSHPTGDRQCHALSRATSDEMEAPCQPGSRKREGSHKNTKNQNGVGLQV